MQLKYNLYSLLNNIKLMVEGLITIIVPVYNASSYIDRCVESLLSQSYDRLEFIFVDDGCTDDSGEKLDKYALSDDRIRVIHQSNGGVSLARNEGLKRAHGEWISFVDADDTIEDRYIERLVPEGRGIQMSLCGLIRVLPDGTLCKWKLFKNGTKPGTITCTIGQVMTEISSYALTGPVCKLFKNSIIQQNKLSFPLDMSFGEDSVFVFSYLLHVKKVHVVEEWLYHYFCTEDSLTIRAESPARMLVAHRVYDLSKRVCEKNGICNLDTIQYHYVDELMQIVSSEDNPIIRYKCYECIEYLSSSNVVRKYMPFYFPVLAKMRGWRFYECLNRIIYGKKW